MAPVVLEIMAKIELRRHEVGRQIHPSRCSLNENVILGEGAEKEAPLNTIEASG